MSRATMVLLGSQRITECELTCVAPSTQVGSGSSTDLRRRVGQGPYTHSPRRKAQSEIGYKWRSPKALRDCHLCQVSTWLEPFVSVVIPLRNEVRHIPGVAECCRLTSNSRVPSADIPYSNDRFKTIFGIVLLLKRGDREVILFRGRFDDTSGRAGSDEPRKHSLLRSR